jgi:hypothetical protein
MLLKFTFRTKPITIIVPLETIQWAVVQIQSIL